MSLTTCKTLTCDVIVYIIVWAVRMYTFLFLIACCLTTNIITDNYVRFGAQDQWSRNRNFAQHPLQTGHQVRHWVCGTDRGPHLHIPQKTFQVGADFPGAAWGKHRNILIKSAMKANACATEGPQLHAGIHLHLIHKHVHPSLLPA